MYQVRLNLESGRSIFVAAYPKEISMTAHDRQVTMTVIEARRLAQYLRDAIEIALEKME